MQRLLPPTLVGALIVLMVLLHLITPTSSGVVAPARLIGLLVAGAGVALTLHGSSLFSKVSTNIKTFDRPDTLVAEGPFRYTRNPMYLGFVLLLFGLALALGSLVPFIGPMIFFIAANNWYIPFEEGRMSQEFGQSYDAYRARVPRWLGVRRGQEWSETR